LANLAGPIDFLRVSHYIVDMYIRTITRKNKDDTKVTYVQLAHNERDSETGQPKAKILFNFGRIETLDVEHLKRLIKSISRFLPPQDVLETEVQMKHRGRLLKWQKSRSYGGIYLVSALWEKLNFRKILEKRSQNRQFSVPIVQGIFAMIANRCLAPTSKLAVTEWVEQDVYIPDLPAIDAHVLYRAMDFLLEHQRQFEQEIYWSVADLLNLEVDLLFIDTTSTYFETEEESDLKRRGYSKDHRDDLPQVIIGLAVSRSGIPVRHWVFQGNTVDMTTIQRIKDDLREWRLHRCIAVFDAGMGSEANLHYIQRGGGHYITGRKMKSGEADVQQALSQKGRYTPIPAEINDPSEQQSLYAKEVIIGDGEKRKRLVLVKNVKEQQRQQQTRQKLIAYMEEELNKLNGSKRKSDSKAAQALMSHRVYGKYIKQLKNGQLSLNRTKLRQESIYDGKYLIQTSDDTLSLRDIVLGFKQLYDVEQAFRTLKTTLDLRPNYHSKDDRIRCHIFLCFISLLLARIAENKTGKSWSRIRREMNRIHYGEFQIDNKMVCQLTELTKEQKEILNALEIKEPSTIVDIYDR
jgi:transposase